MRKKKRSIATGAAEGADTKQRPAKKARTEPNADDSADSDDDGEDANDDAGTDHIDHVRGFKVDDAVGKNASILGERKLTAKQKRAAVRAQKRKKIGSNFYEVSNVKNKNRSKNKPGKGGKPGKD